VGNFTSSAEQLGCRDVGCDGRIVAKTALGHVVAESDSRFRGMTSSCVWTFFRLNEFGVVAMGDGGLVGWSALADCDLGLETFVVGCAEGRGDDGSEFQGVGRCDVGVVGGAVAEGFDEGVVVGRADLLEELDVEDVGVVGGLGDVGDEAGDGVEVAGHEVDVGYGGDGLVGGLRRGEGGGQEEKGEQNGSAADWHGFMMPLRGEWGGREQVSRLAGAMPFPVVKGRSPAPEKP
jgi:hypothetical protein